MLCNVAGVSRLFQLCQQSVRVFLFMWFMCYVFISVVFFFEVYRVSFIVCSVQCILGLPTVMLGYIVFLSMRSANDTLYIGGPSAFTIHS
jgi:ABC-type tungstate transport system substrate-binding protein